MVAMEKHAVRLVRYRCYRIDGNEMASIAMSTVAVLRVV